MTDDEARAQADLDALLDVAGDGVLVFDRAGRLVRASRQARECLRAQEGRAPEELGARADSPGLDGTPELLRPAARALRGETVDRELIGSDGRRRRVRAAPIRDAAGEIRGAVSVWRDVTDLHAALTERDRLDGAVRTARAVAHAVNNQLSFITGYAGLLIDDVGDGRAQLTPAQVEMLGGMLAAAEEAAAMIARLQRVARFEAADLGGEPLPGPGVATNK